MKSYVLAAALFAAAAAPASAYTPYLKPERFWVTDPSVEVEGSFATEFFTPSIALGANITILNGSGDPISADRIAVTPAGSTELQAELARGGTYRISTGEVRGQVGRIVAQNGSWVAVADGVELPADAEVRTIQTISVADTYVTRGTPSRDSVDQTIGRLVMRPITHPNQVLAAQGIEVELQFDGAPMPNAAIVVYGAGETDAYQNRVVPTDAAGRAIITFDAPGQYILVARRVAEQPAGSAAQLASYMTTLTLEALDQLYAETQIGEPAEEAQPERRRERTPARRRVGRPDY